MGQGQDAVEAVSFLTSATARLRLLDHLRTGPATQGELQSALDLPQSTLARNLGKLRDRGWVVETGDGDDGSARDDDGRARYRLTVLGAAAVDNLEPVADRTSVLARLTADPDAFPLDTDDFDVGRLAAATWRVSSETEPYAVANRVRSVIEGSTSIESVRPHPDPAYSDVLSRVADAPDREVTSVVPVDSLDIDTGSGCGGDATPEGRTTADVGRTTEAGQTGTDGRKSDDATESGTPAGGLTGLSRQAVDDTVDYATIVVDRERVLLTGGHRGGMPSVLVETEDEAVLEWAIDRFERYLASAWPVGEEER